MRSGYSYVPSGIKLLSAKNIQNGVALYPTYDVDQSYRRRQGNNITIPDIALGIADYYRYLTQWSDSDTTYSPWGSALARAVCCYCSHALYKIFHTALVGSGMACTHSTAMYGALPAI